MNRQQHAGVSWVATAGLLQPPLSLDRGHAQVNEVPLEESGTHMPELKTNPSTDKSTLLAINVNTHVDFMNIFVDFLRICEQNRCNDGL